MMIKYEEFNNCIIVKSTKGDMSDIIQDIIDKNPNRTLFFPDGEYILEKPICTPAEPRKSVSLKLSQYAVIRASDTWNHNDAMIRLGGKDPFNDNRAFGSNYGIEGGFIDGNGKATAICIESGRETFIRNISIKNALMGIHIKFGANSGSSDADVLNVTITGNRTNDSVGILSEGSDNTFANIRMKDVFIGVHLVGSANFLRNVHPLYTLDYTDYQNSIAFLDDSQNWYDNCYNDNFGVGYCTTTNYVCFYNNCYSFWYSDKGEKHTAFKAVETFSSILTNFGIRFRFANVENIVLEDCTKSGRGKFNNLYFDNEFSSDDAHKPYCTGEITHI